MASIIENDLVHSILGRRVNPPPRPPGRRVPRSGRAWAAGAWAAGAPREKNQLFRLSGQKNQLFRLAGLGRRVPRPKQAWAAGARAAGAPEAQDTMDWHNTHGSRSPIIQRSQNRVQAEVTYSLPV